MRDKSNKFPDTSDFSGRVFTRSDYTDNKVYDDISDKTLSLSLFFQVVLYTFLDAIASLQQGHGCHTFSDAFWNSLTLWDFWKHHTRYSGLSQMVSKLSYRVQRIVSDAFWNVIHGYTGLSRMLSKNIIHGT